ncbi:MAG: EAL domain-containing protein [Oscillospiraceae bacterium]
MQKNKNKHFNFSLRDKNIFAFSIIIFAIICIFFGLVCFQYYHNLQDTVKAEGNGYMQEISEQMATNVSKKIDDNFSVLSTFAALFESSNSISHELLESQKALWGYQKIMMLDNHGTAYDSYGNSVEMLNSNFLEDIIVEKAPAIAPSQMVDGVECIVFAIPIEPFEREGATLVALAASYDLSTFDRLLSMSAFDGKCYAHIIRRDGSVVIRSSSPNAMETGYNVLNSLEKASFSGNAQLDSIKRDISNDKRGQAEFSIGGIREYMTYTPFGTQGWSLLTFIPVSEINEKSDSMLRVTLLMCALITIIFTLLLATIMFSFYRNKHALEKAAYIDPVTGGNTMQRFYELSRPILNSSSKLQYALVYLNIKKFKVLNEQFGREICDSALIAIEHGISSDLSSGECIGRLFADNFCILIKYSGEAELLPRLDGWEKKSVAFMRKMATIFPPMIIEFGVYIIADNFMQIPHMIDRAKLSLSERECQIRGKYRYSIYDENVRRVLFREKQLEDMMDRALKNNEYQVYLQPKFHTQSEKIGGAEALVRWVNPNEGMIYPNEFIPLFEKNGFILQLDIFVFESVCRLLRRWLDKGLTPLKISVNCSRMHLRNADFIDRYSTIANSYNLPHELLEIEITENAVFEDVEYLSKIITKIHDAGFGCSMDDFGSGYSSLNLIKDIPVDTIKLDRFFFSGDPSDLQRTESVVGSVISMSQALGINTVAEGIEDRAQVEMLKRLGCDLIQGFYFAKPMPIPQFEELAFGAASPLNI